MLQKVSDKTQRILDLAEYIEGLNDYEFDMGSWSKCICGHLLRREGYLHSDDWRRGAELLGLSEVDMSKLVSNRDQTRQQAARLLKHLAVTGEVI